MGVLAALIAIIVGVGIWVVFTYSSGGPVVSAREMGERATAARDMVIGDLAPGKALYFRTDSYNAGQSTTEESWMVLGDKEELVRAVTQVRDTGGSLIATAESRGGVLTHSDHVTGDVITLPDATGYSMSDWVASALTGIETLNSRDPRTGRGQL